MKTTKSNKTATQAFGILVFAMLLLSNFSFALTMPIGSWTDWMDRDNPSGEGDYEDLASFTDVCTAPLAIECQTLDGVGHAQAGQSVTCDTSYGFKCVNAENNNSCLDYRVRFYCLSANKAPVISGTGGPTSINVNEQGTWSVTASDPENGPLVYTIVWGDEPQTSSGSALKVLAQEATFQHTYYNPGTYTVVIYAQDEQGANARSSITVNVGKGTPNYEKVDVSVSAEPYQVKLYDTYKVTGKITYMQGATGGTPQKFKVVTSSTPLLSISAAAKASAQVRLEASQEDILQALVNYFTTTKPATAPSAIPPAESQTAPAESAAAGQTAVASVAEKTTVSNSQERVDYVSLYPGESTTVSAYFTARTPGTKVVRVRVYQYDDRIVCAQASGSSVQAPCERYKLVAQDSAKVEVSGKDETPPSPPSEGTIKIYKGWNMVSVPVGASVSMKEVSSQCDSKPYAWKLTGTGYVKEYTLSPGIGYWIKSSGECEYDVAVSSNSQGYATPELFAGWNLVAAPESAVSISDYAGSCSISQGPWYYSHTTGSAKPEYVYSSSLEPGRAYWIYADSACAPGSDLPPSPPS